MSVHLTAHPECCQHVQAQAVSQQQSNAIAEQAPPAQVFPQQPAQQHDRDAQGTMDDAVGSISEPDAASSREQASLFKRPGEGEPAAPEESAEDKLDSRCTRWAQQQLGAISMCLLSPGSETGALGA